MIKRTVALALLACGASTAANAADFGLYGEAGTFGLGGGLSVQLNDHFSVRAGYSTYTYDVEDYEAEDMTLDGEADVSAGKLVLDWYPFGGGFRIGAGVMLNDTSAVANARPSAGGFTINGTFYSTSELEGAQGRVEFDSTAPYVGLGFGRALDSSGRFNLLLDLGVAFTGEPSIEIDANCGQIPASVCAEINDDIAAEKAELEKDADDFKLWPHLGLAISFRF